MILRPPDLTRTATPFPYPSPFRSVDGLTGPADIAGDIRWADDSADDIRHHHRLRLADVGPAAVVKPCLQAFVEPAEALKKCDDELFGAQATPTIVPVADGASDPARQQRRKGGARQGGGRERRGRGKRGGGG